MKYESNRMDFRDWDYYFITVPVLITVYWIIRLGNDDRKLLVDWM